MLYVYRTRRLVKVVFNEINHSTDEIEDDPRYRPSVLHCLHVFQDLDPKRYTDELARKTYAIATGKGYLKAVNKETFDGRRKLAVTHEGLILLTPSVFIRALAESIDASLLISILALLTSIVSVTITALKKN